jgi:hypothetical protein
LTNVRKYFFYWENKSQVLKFYRVSGFELTTSYTVQEDKIRFSTYLGAPRMTGKVIQKVIAFYIGQIVNTTINSIYDNRI